MNKGMFIGGMVTLALICAGVANAELTVTRIAFGDLDPSWDGVNLTTMDGTAGGTTGATTDWHIFGGSDTTPSDQKLDGTGIGTLTFTQGATGGALNGEPSSGSQPDVTVYAQILSGDLRIENGSVIWSAIPGEQYRIEYCDDLLSPDWKTLQTRTATSTTESIVDPEFSAPNKRFYRIISLRYAE